MDSVGKLRSQRYDYDRSYFCDLIVKACVIDYRCNIWILISGTSNGKTDNGNKCRVKRAGPYLLGTTTGNSPVPSITNCLARQDGTDKFRVIKVRLKRRLLAASVFISLFEDVGLLFGWLVTGDQGDEFSKLWRRVVREKRCWTGACVYDTGLRQIRSGVGSVPL